MNVIPIACLEKVHHESLFIRNLLNEPLKKRLDFRCYNLPAILNRPYNVIIDITHAGSVMNEIVFHLFIPTVLEKRVYSRQIVPLILFAVVESSGICIN